MAEAAPTGEVGGIHWHMNMANEITYIAADEKRQDIPVGAAEGPRRKGDRVYRSKV